MPCCTTGGRGSLPQPASESTAHILNELDHTVELGFLSETKKIPERLLRDCETVDRVEVPEGVTQTEDLYFYACPISDTRQLVVELRRGAEGWSVLCWQAESTAHWESDGGLDLWDGT